MNYHNYNYLLFHTLDISLSTITLDNYSDSTINISELHYTQVLVVQSISGVLRFFKF